VLRRMGRVDGCCGVGNILGHRAQAASHPAEHTHTHAQTHNASAPAPVMQHRRGRMKHAPDAMPHQVPDDRHPRSVGDGLDDTPYRSEWNLGATDGYRRCEGLSGCLYKLTRVRLRLALVSCVEVVMGCVLRAVGAVVLEYPYIHPSIHPCIHPSSQPSIHPSSQPASNNHSPRRTLHSCHRGSRPSRQ